MIWDDIEYGIRSECHSLQKSLITEIPLSVVFEDWDWG